MDFPKVSNAKKEFISIQRVKSNLLICTPKATIMSKMNILQSNHVLKSIQPQVYLTLTFDFKVILAIRNICFHLNT